MVGAVSLPIPTRGIEPAFLTIAYPLFANLPNLLKPDSLWADRYAAWIDARRLPVLAVAALVAIASALLASRLPLRPDLSNLLPPSARSVKDFNALKDRAKAFGTVFVVIDGGGDPARRERATRELERRIDAQPDELVTEVIYGDQPVRDYFWKHRFLFADFDDLEEAKRALADKIKRAKLEANPFYIDLEDEAGQDLEQRVKDLREKLDDARREVDKPAGFISSDRRLQLLIVRTPFSSADFTRGHRLRELLQSEIDIVIAELPGVDAGLTGNIVKSLDEHRAVVRGMAAAAAITALICALALFLYYRSVLPVMASLWSLAVGTLATFAFAKIAIGHLNLVTAFLAAIVVGNGVNAGLILLARYFEELRAGNEGNEALAGALRGAVRGTLAASLAAGVAYGSLVITDFRGFRHFGVIGFVGMLLCWISAFTVLPAGLALLWRRGRIHANKAPRIGRLLARVLPRRLGGIALAGAVLAVASGIATWRFIASNPLQEDWSDLRPTGQGTEEAIEWSRRLSEGFEIKFDQGTSQRFVVGLERRAQVPEAIAAMEAADEKSGGRLLEDIQSIDDLIPDRQRDKLEVIAEIRRLLADDLVETFADEDRELLEKVTPPPDLRQLTDADIPDALAWPFTERDGTRGRLILATGGLDYKPWNVYHRMEFAERFREIDLPEGARVGGQSFIFADMVEAMGRDGPLATAVALAGAILVVGLVAGFRRHGLVTLICAAVGILGMIALVSLVGLEVNVIDFIALPITIGLGIDYAVNIAARERQDGELGPHHVLATTGGAVLLCSFTTMVGYGSLLTSASGGIRSFGLAAILGELACVVAALALAPTLLSILRRRSMV
jgi:hypothetical protein